MLTSTAWPMIYAPPSKQRSELSKQAFAQSRNERRDLNANDNRDPGRGVFDGAGPARMLHKRARSAGTAGQAVCQADGRNGQGVSNLKTVTYDEFLGFSPCWLDDVEKAERLKEIGKRKDNWTALDVLALEDVDAGDRLWAVLREEFLPADLLHEFACQCAEKALENYDDPDPRSIAAITAKRKWLRGEITDEELSGAREAAWRAAWRAAREAAWCAAREAAREAAWCAAHAAAWCAEWEAEREAVWDEQLEMLIKLIKQMDKK